MNFEFTATGDGPHVHANHLDSLEYALAGTFAATVVLEKSTDGGLSWLTIATSTSTLSVTLLVETSNVGSAWYRWRCTIFASGTVETSLVVTAPGDEEVADTDLATGVTGVLPVANGGTNSATALSNNRVIKSASGKLVEATAITAARVLISDANGIPVHATCTSTTLGYVDPTSSIQTQINTKAPSASPSLSAVTVSDLTASKPVFTDGSKVLVSTGTLPVANGGTNSTAALSNNRVMQSSGSAVVEASAITAARALISDSNGIPTHSATTSTELALLSGLSAVGNVTGAASSTDNAITRMDSTTGKVIQNSTVTLSDTGNMVFGVFAGSGDYITMGTCRISNSSGQTARVEIRVPANGRIELTENAGTQLLTALNTGFNFGPFDGTQFEMKWQVGKNASVYGSPTSLLYHSASAVGTVLTGEDDLISKTVAAATLSADGMALVFEFWGTFAANTNVKAIKIYVAGTSISTVGSGIYNAGTWCIRGKITRTASTTAKWFYTVDTDNTTLTNFAKSGTLTATWANSCVIKLTGETDGISGGGTNDIVNEQGSIFHLSAGN